MWNTSILNRSRRVVVHAYLIVLNYSKHRTRCINKSGGINMTYKCSKCGATFDKEYKFCPKCGSKLFYKKPEEKSQLSEFEEPGEILVAKLADPKPVVKKNEVREPTEKEKKTAKILSIVSICLSSLFLLISILSFIEIMVLNWDIPESAIITTLAITFTVCFIPSIPFGISGRMADVESNVGLAAMIMLICAGTIPVILLIVFLVNSGTIGVIK